VKTLFVALLWWAAPALPAVAGEGAFAVVLDAGHGGTNLGASGLRAGVHEKNVTLDIARRMRKRLEAERGLRVVLCRDADELQPIRTRVRCANESGARLFVSIHANASPMGPTRGTQRGFEVFVLPPVSVDQDAGLAALSPEDPIEGAWAAHLVRATLAESLAAAQRIDWQLGDTLGRDRDRGVKQNGASLDVLQGLTMPAVLVEVGFLDHPEEGFLLASEAGRERIAEGLARAISDLRAREMRGRTDPAITARTSQPGTQRAPDGRR
jgi:N-acetylmuramoyl-L-alanine amidase